MYMKHSIMSIVMSMTRTTSIHMGQTIRRASRIPIGIITHPCITNTLIIPIYTIATAILPSDVGVSHQNRMFTLHSEAEVLYQNG